MKFLQRGKVASLAETVVAHHENKTLLLSAVEKALWMKTHVFIATAIDSSVMRDPDCSGELKAFSLLSSGELANVYRHLAFWYFYFNDAIDNEKVRTMLKVVYDLSPEHIEGMKLKYSDKQKCLFVLSELLSSAVKYDIGYTTFIRHLVPAFSQANKFGE